MKKALIITSVASMIKQFNMNNIHVLKELGYEVSIATNFKEPGTMPNEDSRKLYDNLKRNGINVYNIPFKRHPVSQENINAYRMIKKIINENKFNIIHCQSPVGGAIARIAAITSRNSESKIIYTAHGFHFYKGAPIINWLVFFPVEKILSKVTDTIITINREDYRLSKLFNAERTLKINGVGIDTNKYSDININILAKRRDFGISEKDFVITSVGELNTNKNHEVIIRALAQVKADNVHYLICGKGPLRKKLVDLTCELGLEENVHFLGFRNDIAEILKISNCFAFPSRREGLGIAAIEAMAAGLPILTSNVHGINDYSIDGISGYKYAPDNVDGFAEGIKKIKNLDSIILNEISRNNIKTSGEYDQSIVNKEMKKLYSLY